MKSGAVMLALCALVFSAMRLNEAIQEQSRAAERIRSFDTLIPPDGSFTGIDTKGNVLTLAKGEDGDLVDVDGVVIFALHEERLAEDYMFWNAVQAMSASFTPNAAGIEYWGVCDSPTRCAHNDALGMITTLAFLDPFQMRSLAVADAAGEVLLYSRSGRLKTRTAIANDPRAMNRVIRQELEQ